MQSRQPQYCTICDCTYSTKYKLARHLVTALHHENTPEPLRTSKPNATQLCTLCNYTTFRKEHYEKHVKTEKHQKNLTLIYNEKVQ